MLCGNGRFGFSLRFRCFFRHLGFVCSLLYAGEIRFRNQREEFEQQNLLLVLGEFHAACLRKFRIRLFLVFRDVVVGLFAHAANLEAEFGVYLDRGFAVFALDEIYELVVLRRVHRTTSLFVEGAVYSLCADDLRSRGYERRQTCGQTDGRNQLHCARENVLGFELLQLSDHVGVHAARNLGFLHEFVRSRESEVCLYLLARVEQGGEIVVLCSLDCAVQFGFYLCRNSVGERIERFRSRFVRAEYRNIEFRTDVFQLLVDFGDGFHVHADVYAEFLAEEVYQLQCGSGGTSAEPPAVGVHHVRSGDDCRIYRCQTVTRRTVRVEIDRDVHGFLQLLDKSADALRRNKSRHILDCYHVGSQCGYLLRLVHEIFVGEYRSRILLAFQTVEQTEFRVFRVYRVADCAVGDTAVLLHVFDCGFHVVHVVQTVENTHDSESALDGVAAETLDDFIGVRSVAEEVASARKCGEFRNVADCLLDAFQTIPRIFVEIAHHRIRHCTAPNFHCEEVSILVVRQTTFDLCLRHSGGERRLLSVTKSQISDFKFFCHNIIVKFDILPFVFIVIFITKI